MQGINKEQLKKFIETELTGNLQILIDPKLKDSFSQARINTWMDLVSDRICHHIEKQIK